MLRVLQPGESISTSNFGGFCPYYYVDPDDGRVVVADSADEIISFLPRNARRIDATGCLSLLCFYHLLGDRTLIEGIRRIPWHSTLYADGTVDRRPPISHRHLVANPEDIAADLLRCLEDEIGGYVQETGVVWLLLSGGLDSRVTAGVVRRLQQDRQLDVRAVTWGIGQSRDVAYASRIAEEYGWEWHHLTYTPETLWNNLRLAAEWGGAEAAAIHFHGLSMLKDLVGPDDVVIASSWGDGIGRGETMGRHLMDMTVPKVRNKDLLIHRSLAARCVAEAQADQALAWSAEPDRSRHVIVELDSTENFMRRMISHAMNYVRTFCRLEQVFTADETVRTMWSYSPVCRQTEVYFRLFELMDPFLYNLPWSRTGVAPSGAAETDPTLAKDFHKWGTWLRQQKHAEIKRLLWDGGLASLGVLNMSQVRRCFKVWLNEPLESSGLTQTILQLISLELLRDSFDLAPARDPTGPIDYAIARLYYTSKDTVKKLVQAV